MQYRIDVYDTNDFLFQKLHARGDRRAAEYYANELLEVLKQDSWTMSFEEGGNVCVYRIKIKNEMKEGAI